MSWLRNRRRRRFTVNSFPESWQSILARNAPFRSHLEPQRRQKLDHAIQVFVAEKNWEGCGGLILQDEQRVTIAAHAMRLTLGFADDYFDALASILVYPTAYEAPSRQIIGTSVVLEGTSARSGESWYHGPVILAWSDVLQVTRPARKAHNVVLHEFAHQLDTRNGCPADGVPVIESAKDAERWMAVTGEAYDRLCNICRHSKPNVLDCYGTTNMAEFFAVATEAFFEKPRELATSWPKLYSVLRDFYRQDPKHEVQQSHCR